MQAVPRRGRDLPVEADGAALEEGDEHDGDEGRGHGGPGGLNDGGDPVDAVRDARVEEQQDADLQPEHGRDEHARHEHEDAARPDAVEVVRVEVVGVLDDVRGVAEPQVVDVGDDARDHDQHRRDDQDEARVEPLAAPGPEAEAGEQDQQRQRRRGVVDLLSLFRG